MDAIYTFNNYSEDSRPRLQFPARTGRQTTYAQWLDYQFQLNHDESPPPPEPDRPLAPTIVNHGRWLWLCPACLTAVQVSETDGAVDLCCCPACFSQGFVQPAFPADRAAIETELYRQPGYRWNAPFRNWEPGWSLAYLRERTARAQAKLAAGATYVRSASIGTPRTWSVGELLTAANMNTFVREIQKDLIGTNGPIEYLDALVAAGFTTAERNALTAQNGMVLYNSTIGRIEERENGEWRTNPRLHQSQLIQGGGHTVIPHTLGVKPISFQLLYERVKDSEHLGYSLGDQVFVLQAHSDQSPGYAIYDVTTTQYIVAMPGRSLFSGGTGYRHADMSSKNFHANSADARQSIHIDNSPTTTDTRGGWAARLIAIG